MAEQLDLTVQVPAEDWAYMQRRLAWFEALLLRVVRDRGSFNEWMDAAELAALRLPGLPPTRSGISQKARRDDWPRQRDGNRVSFHVSALPARAFDALIARILDLPPLDADTDDLFNLPTPPAPAGPMPENAAPPWVLPLMRLMKSEGDWGAAWSALPDHLGKGIALPDVKEAARILIALRLM